MQGPELLQSRSSRDSPEKALRSRRTSQAKQPRPAPDCHSLQKFIAQRLRQAVDQLGCVNMETGTGGPEEGLSQLQGKMVNRVCLHGSHKGTSSLCALSSLQNILYVFPLVKSTLMPGQGTLQ